MARISSILVAAALAGSPVLAQDAHVGLGLSTLGGVIEGGYRIDPNFRVRGQLIGGLSLDRSEEFEGTNYDIDAGLNSVALIGDYYVNGGGFRVSGGIVISNNELKGTATASGANTIEVNGQTFNAGTVDLTTEFDNKVSPMVTVGYDWGVTNNFVLSGEIGAMYIGGVNIKAVSDTVAIQTQLDDPNGDFQKAVSDAKDFKLYPYISLIASYRF